MRPERSSGESFKAVQRSLLQKQILFSLPTQTSLIKKNVKGNWDDWFFSWHIIFHLSNVFPCLPPSQPQPTHPIPGFTILRKIGNGWRGTECLIGSIYPSIEDRVKLEGGVVNYIFKKRREPWPCVS